MPQPEHAVVTGDELTVTPLGVSVVIMAYNEAATVEATVLETVHALRASQIPNEIVIVDDGSNDGTADIADALALRLPEVRVIHHDGNRGLGAVYRTGFEAACRDCVTFFPADGQFPASIIPAFRDLIADHDLVLGFLERRNGALVSKVLSAVERILYFCLFGPLPRFQGVMMVRRHVLMAERLQSSGRGWGILMELVIKGSRGPYRVVSALTAYRPRTSGRSKVNNIRTILANLREMLALRWALWR